MEDKTSKVTPQAKQTEEQKSASVTENATQEQPRKTATERRADIIVSALERAKENGGVLLNAAQKTAPSFYPKGVTVSPFNSVILAMQSDEKGYSTNLVTLFSDAKKRGESVKGRETGIPFSWFSWNEYVNKNNPEDKISRHDYKALSPDEQTQYKGIRTNENRIVFNIDQTTLSHVNKEEYEKAVLEHGGVQDRDVSHKNDMYLHVEVNDFILNVRDNLVPIRKDGSGISSYDKQKDAVYMSAQNAYESYPEYVQDVTRQIVAATAHPQRLNRHSSQNYESLVTELASASKQLEFSLPAKLSPKAMEHVDSIIDSLKKNPKLVESIEQDVNKSMAMIQKAANGEKVGLRPTTNEMDNWRANLPKEGTVPDKFDAVLLLKDDEGKWSVYVKPENENAFAVHPNPYDVGMFFNVIRSNDAEKTESFRRELGQKYYADIAKHPEKAVELFKSNASEADLARIEKMNIFKTKEETPRILAIATIDGERQKPREVSQDQWQRMWLAPDMQDYKKHLAATLYSDVLGEGKEQQQVQQNTESAEQKEPVTLDIPRWSLNYIINGDPEGITDEEKDIVDKFLDENFADGFIPEELENTEKEFNVSPAFGTRNPKALPDKGESPYQAVDTVAVRFSPAGYFETRDENKEKDVKTDKKSEQSYDPMAHQEDKECAKMLKDIEKLEKKCRAETQPNRQRALFEEKKALEAKLQERVAMLQKQSEQKEEKQETEKQSGAKKPKKSELSPLLKQFLDLKSKHPDALLLFRTGDFYETYKDDAKNASKILGITLTKSSKVKDDEGKPLAMAGFPYHALDAYLPKLIRAGQRVAICDQIEQPKEMLKHRGSSETVTDQEQNIGKEESQSRGFHR